MSLPADLDRVLQADDWLRRMARQLVGDSHASEDLAQDAWVAALSRGRTDRPWLFGVLRNLRRETARREVRNEDLVSTASLPKDAPPADDVVSELMLRKHITEQLLELDEPYRTVIFLRFVQDEKLPAIARRTGVAVSTVHQRIARGLELMRTSLDEHYGGTRNSWALGLMSLANPPGAAATLFGGFILGTSAKIVAAVALFAGTLAVVWSDESEPTKQVAASIAPAPSPTETDDQVANLNSTPVSTSRSEIEAVPEAIETLETVAASTAPPLLGYVIDLNGLPVAGARIGLAETTPTSSTLSDANGRFELANTNNTEADPSFECLDKGFITLLDGTPSGSEFVVLVGRVADFAGVVIDESGQPIANASLKFDIKQSLFREYSIPRPFLWSNRNNTTRAQESDELGRFEFPRAAGGSHSALWVRANGYESQTVNLPASGDTALQVVLTPLADERQIRGFVLDQAGLPVSDASVAAGKAIVRSDERGAFSISVQTSYSGIHVDSGDGIWEPKYDISTLRAHFVGYLPAELPIENIEYDQQVILRLGSSTLEINGRVIDENGLPRPSVIVWVADLTDFGYQTSETGEARAVWNVSIEEQNGAGVRGCASLTDDLGRFQLKGLLNRDYELRAFDTTSATQAGPVIVPAGTTNFEFVLESELYTQRVAGQIVNASGDPIEGVWISPRRNMTVSSGARVPHMSNATIGTHTDEDGLFEFESLATIGTELELQHASFFIERFDLKDRDDLDQLVIVQPVICELEVELEWDSEQGDIIEILDERGAPLRLIQSHGVFVSMGEFVKVTDGRTGVFDVSETARTVVLKKNGIEVARKSVEVVPSQRTLVRL